MFLWEETRSVDKTGAVRLKGLVYDAGVDLIGKKVDLRFDPFDLSVVEIWHNGLFVRKSTELVIREFLPKSTPPENTAAAPGSSRLLDVYKNRNDSREKQKNAAISFVDMLGKGGKANV